MGTKRTRIGEDGAYVDMIHHRLDHTEGKDTPLFASAPAQGSLL